LGGRILLRKNGLGAPLIQRFRALFGLEGALSGAFDGLLMGF